MKFVVPLEILRHFLYLHQVQSLIEGDQTLLISQSPHGNRGLFPGFQNASYYFKALYPEDRSDGVKRWGGARRSD